MTQSPDSDTGLTASLSEEKPSAESKTKRYVKRRVRRTNPSAESSDEEEEKPIKQRSRRRKVFLRRVNPSLTGSSGAETPYLADSSDDEDEELGVERMGGLVTQSSDSGTGLPASLSGEKNLAESNTKRYVKRRVSRSNPSAESSDEEDEKPIKQRRRRRRKVFLRRVNPSLTESSGAETPYLADSSDDEDEEPGVESMGGKVVGNMKGGAGESYEEVLTMAILKAGENVKLDEPTLGDGSCFSHAIVQQCRRRPVKLFLQSRGVTIYDFMHLKKMVNQFVQANINTPKVQNLRVNFDASQLNMHWEDMPRRSWRQYWNDMQQPTGLRAWADNIFVQATAWCLNLDLRIIYAGADTQGQTVTTTDGNFSPVAGGERRPLLYLGYIVNEHYQSLLPAVEDDYVPPCLAQPAVDNALQNALQALMEAKAKQGTQVSSKKTTSSHQTSKSAHFNIF